MLFDLANRSLVQKMALLVIGSTLFASVAIGAVGDLMLRRVATDLIEAKLSSRAISCGLQQVGQAAGNVQAHLLSADARALSPVPSQVTGVSVKAQPVRSRRRTMERSSEPCEGLFCS
jgi:hypothetical protein